MQSYMVHETHLTDFCSEKSANPKIKEYMIKLTINISLTQCGIFLIIIHRRTLAHNTCLSAVRYKSHLNKAWIEDKWISMDRIST